MIRKFGYLSPQSRAALLAGRQLSFFDTVGAAKYLDGTFERHIEGQKLVYADHASKSAHASTTYNGRAMVAQAATKVDTPAWKSKDLEDNCYFFCYPDQHTVLGHGLAIPEVTSTENVLHHAFGFPDELPRGDYSKCVDPTAILPPREPIRYDLLLKSEPSGRLNTEQAPQVYPVYKHTSLSPAISEYNSSSKAEGMVKIYRA